jgi:N-acetyl-gamma-glutamyl-phosphate reductase
VSTIHVIGAAGFAGAQLAALVNDHPYFELGQITSRTEAGKYLVDVTPEYRVGRQLTELDLGAIASDDFAAVCYPHAEAVAVVAPLIDSGVRVVDVSADHRLRDPAAYPVHYDFEHPRPDLLQMAVYGLPELYRDAIVDAQLVANPGCYPETALLGLLPICRDISEVVIDAKSGVSGAGRTPSSVVHYSNVTDSIWPYKVFAHRHQPEIAQELGQDLIFTPHLLPVDRGLMCSSYARVDREAIPDQATLDARYSDFYEDHPFVEPVVSPPTMRAVQRTNFAQVCPLLSPDGERVAVFSVLDNLMKGAAGQALQNFNLMAGRPETEGLL